MIFPKDEFEHSGSLEFCKIVVLKLPIGITEWYYQSRHYEFWIIAPNEILLLLQ